MTARYRVDMDKAVEKLQVSTGGNDLKRIQDFLLIALNTVPLHKLDNIKSTSLTMISRMGLNSLTSAVVASTFLRQKRRCIMSYGVILEECLFKLLTIFSNRAF